MSQLDADRQAQASIKKWRGESVDPETLWGYFVTAVRPVVAPKSLSWQTQVKWAMTDYVLPEFGHVALTEITRPALQHFFNGLALIKDENGKRILGDTSIGKIKTVLSFVMNLAEADQLIPANPLRHVRLTAPLVREKTSLEPANLWKLYQAAHPRLKPIILLQGFAGARIGEACGAMKSHVDESGVWCPQQQVLQHKGGAIVSDRLKTSNSYRAVPLPTEVWKILRQSDSLWLAPNSEGGHLLPNNVQTMLDKACIDAKVQRITTHELRHTFISILENALELPSPVVAELARKSKSGPLRGYSRSWLKLRQAKMDEFWKLVTTQDERKVRTLL